MLGMKNHFDVRGSIEIREVEIAGVACICKYMLYIFNKYLFKCQCNFALRLLLQILFCSYLSITTTKEPECNAGPINVTMRY